MTPIQALFARTPPQSAECTCNKRKVVAPEMDKEHLRRQRAKTNERNRKRREANRERRNSIESARRKVYAQAIMCVLRSRDKWLSTQDIVAAVPYRSYATAKLALRQLHADGKIINNGAPTKGKRWRAR